MPNFYNLLQKTTFIFIFHILYSKKGGIKMNNTQNSLNPNKGKKCPCEDKYGPKPFTKNTQSTSNNNPAPKQ